MTISTAMLVRNPPIERLSVLIDFLQPFIKEFIIIDTGSDQETIDLMRGWDKVQIYEREWKHDYAWARNEGLPYITGDWILAIDPDELPSVGMIAFLLTASSPNTPIPEALGWRFMRRNWYGGKLLPHEECEWHCNFFKAGHGRWYKRVHEQVMLEGNPETMTQFTDILPKAPDTAILYHGKPFEERNRNLEYYKYLESLNA